eukprot:302378_1
MILNEQLNKQLMIQLSIEKRYILWILHITYHYIIKYYYLQQLKHQKYLYHECYGILLLFRYVYHHINPLSIEKHDYEIYKSTIIIYLLLYSILWNYIVILLQTIITLLIILFNKLHSYVNVNSIQISLSTLSAISGNNLIIKTKTINSILPRIFKISQFTN